MKKTLSAFLFMLLLSMTAAVSVIAADPAVSVIAADPAVSVIAADPAVPVIAADLAVPVIAADPAVPVIAADPAVPVIAADPVDPVIAADVAVPVFAPVPACAEVFAFAPVPVFAADSLPRLVDDADLLTDSEEKELMSRLDEISIRQQADVVVVTVDSLGGRSAMDYADDFYDGNGYRKDGVLLLVSMEQRDWWISTAGFGITALTDAGLDYISERFLDDLSDGNYAQAFSVYAELCDDFFSQAKKGSPYDAGHLPKAPFHVYRSLAASFAAGLILALVIMGIMAGQLKTVRSRSHASDYVKKGSLHVTRSRDLFLYRHVDRKKKAEAAQSGRSGGSSTHRSSSGASHGGRGGKF